MTMKQCTKCGVEKPRTNEFFFSYVGRSIDGLRPICRDCYLKYQREIRKAKRMRASR